jgi:hypothetical protein
MKMHVDRLQIVCGLCARPAIPTSDFDDDPRYPHQKGKASRDYASGPTEPAIRVVLNSEKTTGKPKPYAVLLTRTNQSIRTRGPAHIQNGPIDAGIRVLETELHERDAFKAVFSFQQTLDGLNPADVPNLDKAKLYVLEFTHEVMQRLAAEEGGGKKDDQTSAVAGAA